MGYVDYQMGNVTISRVYFVEGSGRNLFSVGQFCDSDLEVAFRKHTCYIRDLEGVDLLKGSRGSNLYTLSLEDMILSSPICLLSKASKTKSWLWHQRKPDLSYLHVYGALCYPTNDNEDLRKLKPKADIGIFLTAMASEQFDLGPAPQLLTPGTISSGLVPNPPSPTPYVPPTKKDWDILFQTMFDEYFNPPPSVASPVPAVVSPEPADPTGTPSSNTIDQDAPSPTCRRTHCKHTAEDDLEVFSTDDLGLDWISAHTFLTRLQKLSSYASGHLKVFEKAACLEKASFSFTPGHVEVS
ncbi:hypothetical protein Tco_0654968 [Tanacetum coccineum]|uniref:Integrase, catalytic region, zinc finger, CCHC-type, peptidase aspartic, catalytic n=1 Tax=Tanacetum coccineum TaxID=301880 RepID=A0ABQ4X4N4_9ASTR